MSLRAPLFITATSACIAVGASMTYCPRPSDPQRMRQPAQDARPSTDRDAARLAQRRTPIVEVFENTRDAVVNISSTEIVEVRRGGSIFDDMFADLFDMPIPDRRREIQRTSVGSGFVIHREGYLVTNAHVVARTTERRVTFADGTEYDADVIAIDESTDLAVLKIDADAPLPELPLGRSDDLLTGETVIAIGNPLGYQHTVTTGVVSATDRELQIRRNLMMTGLIQTDASINPGNSGGPLLNVLGELIGINTAIRGDAQNLSFAIAVDQLRAMLPDLLDVERRYRFNDGLRVDSLREPVIVAVEEGSPADRAGLQPGDVVRTVNGTPVREGIDYDIAMIGWRAGDRVRLAVQRGEQRINAALTLDARPQPDGKRLAQQRLGIQVRTIPAEVAAQLNLRNNTGLLIADLERDGPAERVGLVPGDIILSIGRHFVRSIDDLGDLLEFADPGDDLTVSVLRVDRRGKARLTGRIRVR